MARNKQPERRKHVPQRSCVVCHKTMDKRDLVRIVNDPDEGLVVDPTGKRKGRGAYLCHDQACWEKALASDVLGRALRTQISDANKDRLEKLRPR